jgi:phage-related minor tail protein
MAASQNIARLGIVLGLDSAELVTKITEAQQKFGKFKAQIKRDSEDAAKEIVRLEMATKNYGKTLTELEKIEDQIRLGKYRNQPDVIINNLKAQAAAYDKVAAAAKAAEQAKMGKAGGMTAQQQAALGYQTTDIITSLAGGQNPMMVLLQQGGQLRDQFGGFKPLFAGITAAITPMMVAMTGAAAAVGGFAIAMYKGAQESEKFQNTMILTGRFAGITEGQFNNLSMAIKRDFGGSIGAAREVMDMLVSSGQFTGQALYSVGAAITKVASLSGEAASDVAKNLIPALDGSASSAANLNKQYHFLTFAQYKQIETLNEQGKIQEAIRVTADALTDSLTKQEQRIGSIEKAWKFLKNGMSDVWEWMKSIGRDETPMEKMIKSAEKYAQYAKDKRGGGANSKVARDALADYEKYAAQVGEAAKKAEDESIAKAKEAERIKLEERIGGNKKYRDIQKQIDDAAAEANYQREAYGLEKFAQLEKQAAFDVAKAKNEQERLIADEGGATRIQRMKLFAEQERAINEKLARDKEDLYKESRKKFEDLAKTEMDSIDQERERMQVYKDNLISSQKDLDIALARLAVQQKLTELFAQENMSDKDRAIAADRIRFIGKQKEAVIEQREQLKMLQDMNQSVFNNMGNAIDNFVRTGKLSFKDLTRSIIQDLISIAMRAQMMAMFKGFSFFGPSAGAGSLNYSLTAGQSMGGLGLKAPIPQASGGDVQGGMPYYVGEQGPELFVPQGAGTIMPNKMIGGMMNNQPQVVYNGPYIASMNAIDTQSGIQFLAKNKSTIWAVNQSAQRSLPASR